jgi:hypothetical protein
VEVEVVEHNLQEIIELAVVEQVVIENLLVLFQVVIQLLL